MRLADSLHSAPFRIAVVYAVLFAASVVVLFGVVFWLTTGEMDHGLRDDIWQDVRELTAIHRDGGMAALEKAVNERLHNPRGTDAIYRLVSTDGTLIAGRGRHIPRFSGWREIRLPRAGLRLGGEDELVAYLARFVDLGDGFLLVGHSRQGVIEVHEVLLRSFGWALGLTVVFALAGGVLMSRDALRRVEEINRTTREIVEGHLSRRVPVRGTGDELDGLATSINHMLDRIGTLMGNLRQVGSDLAHDLRTPLGRLRQRLESARTGEHTVEGYREAMERAIEETDAILETFSAILGISQIEAGARRASFTDVDLSETAGRIVEVYESVAEDNGQRLRQSIQPDVRVRGDRDLLTQLLANLVENAIRHTPAGTLIEVGVAAGTSAATAVVRDTGPGIPAGERDRVLGRFYHLEASRTTPGSGLGLALVKAVADLHGATLELGDAAPGLRVTLTFPTVVAST